MGDGRMKPDVRQKVLLFISTYKGTRHKTFPFGQDGFHFDAPDLKRAPFRVQTLRQLITEGFVTSKGPVRLTLKGEHELAELKKPVPAGSHVKNRVIYHLVKSGERKGFALHATQLNGNDLEVHGAQHYPTAMDIVAHIRNMPKKGRQKVFRELIKDLTAASARVTEASDRKGRFNGPTGYDSTDK